MACENCKSKFFKQAGELFEGKWFCQKTCAELAKKTEEPLTKKEENKKEGIIKDEDLEKATNDLISLETIK